MRATDSMSFGTATWVWLSMDRVWLGNFGWTVYPGPGAFLAAAVCGGQRGGQICIWRGGVARIPDDIYVIE